jgi:hypothetical protein
MSHELEISRNLPSFGSDRKFPDVLENESVTAECKSSDDDPLLLAHHQN